MVLKRDSLAPPAEEEVTEALPEPVAEDEPIRKPRAKKVSE